MKKIIYLSIFFAPILLVAQEKKLTPRQIKKAEAKAKVDKLIQQEEEGALIFRKQSAFGIKFNTDGYGIFYERGKFKSVTKTNLWWVELSERKHPKEEKFAKGDPTFGFIVGNPFIYGKVNNFYNFSVGIGQQKLIAGKGNKNGVATTLIYGGGLSVALMKPYFLEIEDPATLKTKVIRYNEDTINFLDPTRIMGAAGFGKGFNQINYIPGAHARTALRFDYGRYTETLSAIEVGINASFYSKKIQQMAQNKENNFFFNAYVALTFGRRK